MNRYFNVNGDCKPELHYMADIKDKLIEIREMVDKGQYFTINRARQYGKTTTLRALARFLQDAYVVISLDFQKEMSDAKFKNENTFSIAFASAFLWKLGRYEAMFSDSVRKVIENLRNVLDNCRDELDLVELFRYLSEICRTLARPVVLIIDEADSATNNQVFLDFLSQLRGYYIDRDETAAFHSVILAGVYDIKNIKRKFRPEEEHRTNSPWNIAADFHVDMSFSVKEISGMLEDYEKDHHTGMDTAEMADLIYDYTSGYPFLVSRICNLIDERISEGREFQEKSGAWTKKGLLEAVKLLVREKNTLFESLANKLKDYPELKSILYALLFTGKDIPYNSLNGSIEVAEMFGFVKNNGGKTTISNRIFETVLYNLFLSEEFLTNEIYDAGQKDKNQFVAGGHLNMKLVLEKFVVHFNDLYSSEKESFIEEAGRRYFLLYLKPIINGTGNYYVEAETRDRERTDVIVDYQGEQFVIEMKIWHGNAYHMRGEQQLAEYLEYYHLKKGYMLSFNFNKGKETGVKEHVMGDKVLVEAVV